MRWVVGLLASSARPRIAHSPTAFFGDKTSQPLASEELEALAGVWSTTLDLDDGARRVSLHLDKNGHVNTVRSLQGLSIWAMLFAPDMLCLLPV